MTRIIWLTLAIIGMILASGNIEKAAKDRNTHLFVWYSFCLLMAAVVFANHV